MARYQYGKSRRCVHTDENGKVIKTFKMSISNAQFDFDGTRGDYIFTDVPAGAKWFFFTTFIVVDQNAECIAVDSSSVEAIEPDWVEHKAASEEGVECEGDSPHRQLYYPITMDASKPSPLRFLNRFKPTRHGYINNGRMGV